MTHTFSGIEKRRAELREKLEELRPQLTKLHAADIELQRQVGLARRDDRREDERAFAAQRQAGQPAIVELSSMVTAALDEEEELRRQAGELKIEAGRLLSDMRDKLWPFLGLIVVGPPSVEAEIEPMRRRYLEITG